MTLLKVGYVQLLGTSFDPPTSAVCVHYKDLFHFMPFVFPHYYCTAVGGFCAVGYQSIEVGEYSMVDLQCFKKSLNFTLTPKTT